MGNIPQFTPAKIETKNTILRNYVEGEGKIFFDLINKNRERLKDSFPNILTGTHDEVAAENYIRDKIYEWRQKQTFAFGVWLKKTNQCIGHISIKDIEWRIPRGELAYFISYEFEGKGLMSEAVVSMIKFGFDILKLNRLFLRVIVSNERSITIAEKFGFKREGCMAKDHLTFDEQLVDVYHYGMTGEDFNKIFSG